MKRNFFIMVLVLSVGFIACDNDARYVDLGTGKTVKLVKNDEGLMVNEETKKPVLIYVDTKENDTIYGKTGKVINGHISKTGDNNYTYNADISLDEDGEYKIKDGDYKMKVESDGDIKIKDGDTKTKIDGETGEKKTKND